MEVTASIIITPEQLAEQYADLDDHQMVAFWNHMHTYVQKEYRGGWFSFATQTEFTRTNDTPGLTVGGRLMQKIVGGDY